MATKGYRQPYWIDGDRRTVMCHDGAAWVALDFDQALEYAHAANAEFQMIEYGHVDPRATELVKAAQGGLEFAPLPIA